MTNRKIARPRRAQKQKPARFTKKDRAELREKVEARAAGVPVIPPRPPSAWKNGEVDPQASPLTLAAFLLADFEDVAGAEPGASTGVLEAVARASADEAEIIEHLDTALDHTALVARILRRQQSRNRIAIEIARRLRAAEVRS